MSYILTLLTFIGIIAGWFIFVSTYSVPSCFDGKQNQDEVGVDCGGSCKYLCPSQVAEPIIQFSRAFEVNSSTYNAVAYVENPNINIGIDPIGYTFRLYDKDGVVISEVKSSTYIAAGKITPIFEGGLQTGGRVPVRADLILDNDNRWRKVIPYAEPPIIVKDQTLTRTDDRPKLQATLENVSIQSFRDVEVVTVIFNAKENAIATSRTVVTDLPLKAERDIFFTWPRPFEKELEACTVPVDVALMIDTSGSMNNDSDNPPQPLTDAKAAAVDFVASLSEEDRVSVITFATNAETLSQFSFDHTRTSNIINSIQILPEEELGATNMGAAFVGATGVVDSDREGGRGGARKIAILLTDGIANEPEEPGGEPYALTQASALKARGFSVYTVGLGNEVNETFLKNLASTPQEAEDKFYFSAETSKDLAGVYEKISDSICEKGAAVIHIIPRIPDRLSTN